MDLLQKVSRAYNHALRQNIINTLSEVEKMNVTDLYIKHRTEQSVMSQHLAILRKAKFVNTERRGKVIFYSLNTQVIEKYKACIKYLQDEN